MFTLATYATAVFVFLATSAAGGLALLMFFALVDRLYVWIRRRFTKPTHHPRPKSPR